MQDKISNILIRADSLKYLNTYFEASHVMYKNMIIYKGSVMKKGQWVIHAKFNMKIWISKAFLNMIYKEWFSTCYIILFTLIFLYTLIKLKKIYYDNKIIVKIKINKWN